jgi:hypothetical protein
MNYQEMHEIYRVALDRQAPEASSLVSLSNDLYRAVMAVEDLPRNKRHLVLGHEPASAHTVIMGALITAYQHGREAAGDSVRSDALRLRDTAERLRGLAAQAVAELTYIGSRDA